MKRFFDFNLALLLFLLLLIPMIIIAICVRLTSKGSALHWSDRVGQNNVIFKMPKFRSMWEETPAIPTHLVSDHDELLSPIGNFLRKTSLDELPQLYSVLKGDMSFVGPRPALFNQDDLIELRKENGIDKLMPGITGWAQINGRDELTIFHKVSLEMDYVEKKSFWFDMKILWMTLLKVLKRDNIVH
jgi:O-antigen biosynthesis protein WbqP